MKRREWERLYLARALDPQGFNVRLIRAVDERDGRFLRAVAIAFSEQPPRRKRYSLKARVEAAFQELGERTNGRGVTKKMIREHVNRKIALRHFSQAFRDAGLSWLPRDIPKKDS
jgi:hypothetical protein